MDSLFAAPLPVAPPTGFNRNAVCIRTYLCPTDVILAKEYDRVDLVWWGTGIHRYARLYYTVGEELRQHDSIPLYIWQPVLTNTVLGLVIIEPVQQLVRMSYNSARQLCMFHFKWDHSEHCRRLLEKAIQEGYDVMLVDSGWKEHRWRKGQLLQ